MTLRTSPKRAGFSMIELLVVLAILGFLLALLLPVLQKLREQAARVHTQNDLKFLGLACLTSNDALRRLPPAFGPYGSINGNNGAQPNASIHVHLLPYMEQDNVYRTYLTANPNSTAAIPPFLTPSDPSNPNPAGVQDFAANLRVFSDKGVQTKYNAPMPQLAAVEPSKSAIPRTFLDGTSNTIIFVTRYGECGKGGSRYASAPNSDTAALFGQNPAKAKATATGVTGPFLVHPTAAQCQPTPLMGHSFTPTGIDVGMADGTVRVVSVRISSETWNCAVQPNDGMVLGNDWD